LGVAEDTLKGLPGLKSKRGFAMDYVTSKDGIRIAYKRRGRGQPLVLIHGAAADHTRWEPVLPGLEKQFTVYAVDRRGRGQSGDGDSYTISLEYEDVAAVVDSIPGPVDLLGHSYGAICSVEASLKTSNLRKLVLYEPPIHTGAKKNSPPDSVDRMNSCLNSGEREKALLIFLGEIVGIPKEEMNVLRSLPSWSSRLASAHTIPREESSLGRYALKPERFSRMKTPTLLLLGGDSPPFFRVAIGTLKKVIPNSRIAIIPGQRHAAMDTAPELFLNKVVGFLNEK
jgi:pimeloyl-ACP methyl ester carboxylesterase